GQPPGISGGPGRGRAVDGWTTPAGPCAGRPCRDGSRPGSSFGSDELCGNTVYFVGTTKKPGQNEGHPLGRAPDRPAARGRPRLHRADRPATGPVADHGAEPDRPA